MSTSEPPSADIPTTDVPGTGEQPESQGTDPLTAELGDEGQGDLAPEDEPLDVERTDRAEPQDLRDTLAADGEDAR